MTARPVPRAQLPAGVTCAMTAGGAPLDAETLAAVEQFHTFLRSHKDIGETKACAATYGDGNCPHIPGRAHPDDPNPQGA